MLLEYILTIILAVIVTFISMKVMITVLNCSAEPEKLQPGKKQRRTTCGEICPDDTDQQ